MKKHAGRPRKESGKGSIVHPHIGGMETLGSLPVGGVKGTKAKEGQAHKRSQPQGTAAHHVRGFGHASPHHGVGGLHKKGS